MKNLQDFIAHLQKQPYETRLKILWGTVIGAGIIIVILWMLNLKSTINNLSGTNPTPASTEVKTQESSFVSIERAENTAGLKLFFNLNNTTDDILNVPSLDNISLEADGGTIKPTSITDRQGKPFVQKILSHTQDFGILNFPKIYSDSAVLNFTQMFFERSPDQPLNQKINLDIKKLVKPSDLRN